MHRLWRIIRWLAGTEGTQKIMSLLVLLFLYQFVGWIRQEEGMWLPETVTAVVWTLFAVCFTYFIPKLYYLVRELLQIILVLLVHAVVLEYQFVPLSQVDSMTTWLQANVSQLVPYIWFGLAAWWVFLMMMWAVRTKLGVSFVVILSILFFAVRDSFSVLLLWPQVATIIFCGLCMLIVRHLANLKKKAPESWDNLAEYPGPLIVPVILIIVITFSMGAIVPAIDPILTDPYTAWRQFKGDKVSFLPSSDNSGRAVIPEASDPLLKSSGYSRNDAQLGGQFQYDYSPVFNVETSARTYYRGETRALYTGSGWEASSGDKRARSVTVGTDGKLAPDPAVDTSKLKTNKIKQTITMRNNDVYPVLFGAFPMAQVTLLEYTGKEGADPSQPVPDQHNKLRWSGRQSELRFNTRTNYPRQYELVSETPMLDLDGLKKVDMDKLDKSQWQEYLQLPDKLPDRVVQLARDTTKNETTAYGKVRQLEMHLSTKYPYTNTPDVSKGKSSDFVDRFLFEIKEGYCDYYSTSMVVLTRSLGIPARWVKGYASGTSNEASTMGYIRGAMSDPDAGGTYSIRNSDAHSWMEVYFEGYGWLPFEPTAGFSLPQNYYTEPAASAEAPDANPEASGTSDAAGAWSWLKYMAYGLCAVVLLVAIIVTLIRVFTGRNVLSRFSRGPRADNYAQSIVQEVNRLLRYSKRKGYVRYEHETIREAAARWNTQSYWLAPELAPVLDLFEKAKYSRASVTEEDLVKVQQSVKTLRAQMK
ncbi:transglutaminase domain-containing protein [Paenibacillus sp. FJAT-26967]|uniref:DUF4129 domain-containing transglutaminase family protein n=1 Tax=Paenibacillus sp. FJAT-26967 TaxID=1729690 RepID=UPI000837F5A3|nr:transglutaminase domain-containing protein [Paenibacillus sp. FJAT-26967]